MSMIITRESDGARGAQGIAARDLRGASRLRLALGLVAALGAALLSAPLADAQSADPPARVGRVSIVSGSVSFHSGAAAAGQATSAQQDWTPAELNYPLVTGDSIWSEPGAHAAVEVGPARFRLDGATEVDAEEIDAQTARLRVDQGSVDVRLDALEPGESYVVDTPRGTVTLQTPGLYRVDAGAADRPTRLVVFSGSAGFSAPGSSLTIAAGQAVDVAGAGPYSFVQGAADQTALDQWAAAQDAATVTPVGQTVQYVSPDETGYQDLGRYGAWATAPDYGAVWYPGDMPADWAPYRYGHWAWVYPWGWTWIDDAPWGFAPFHYGRWAEIGGRWGWIPGAVERRPVYAPALVAWIGGNGWSLSLSAGGIAAIGWVPLGAHEAYRPPYRSSSAYLARVNSGYRAVANSAYANRRAATVMSHGDFAASKPVARAALHPSAEVLASAPFVAKPNAATLPPRPTAHAAVSAPRPHPASLPRQTRQAAATPAARPAVAPSHASEATHATPAHATSAHATPVGRPVRPAFDPATPPPLAVERYTPHPAWEPSSAAPRPASRPAPRPAAAHPASHPAPAPHPAAKPEPHPAPAGAPEHREPPHP